MIQREQILQFLQETLTPENFDDYCVNGLQVQGKEIIRKIILGVSVSERLFQATVKARGDLLIVHHGLFWKSDPHPMKITGLLYHRLRLLLQHDINLAAYHLPLDAHPVIGNNAQILQKLGLKSLQTVDVGFLGEFDQPIPLPDFINLVNAKLETNALVLNYGPDLIKKVVVISGGSSPDFLTAVELGADAFVGGDLRENLVRSIEESRMNFINAGHYNTEKFGIQALGKLLQEHFLIPCEYIDIPNPI